MKYRFDVPGKERKKMAEAIGSFIGAEVKYKGAPSFEYEIGAVTVDKTGAVILGEELNESTAEMLFEHLFDLGFECLEVEEPRISIKIPREMLTDENIENLKKVIAAKQDLIKKAIDADNLSINVTDEYIEFPWFSEAKSPDDGKAYMDFVSALCKMAKTLIRVNGKEREVENERYAFRCFLLRLGFIGAEYKADRKVLLRNLSGSSAFRDGKRGGSDV